MALHKHNIIKEIKPKVDEWIRWHIFVLDSVIYSSFGLTALSYVNMSSITLIHRRSEADETISEVIALLVR